MDSRQEDTTPVVCEDCGWKGQVKDCVHGQDIFSNYAMNRMGFVDVDAEPKDFCPSCGSTQLKDIDEELVPA